MSWRFAAGTLGVGQSTTWFYAWGDHHDEHGIQVARARPLPTTGGGVRIITPADFEVTSQGMILELDGGYTYTVTVTNHGPWPCSYEIVGGEV